jgi:hypothetical protein
MRTMAMAYTTRHDDQRLLLVRAVGDEAAFHGGAGADLAGAKRFAGPRRIDSRQPAFFNDSTCPRYRRSCRKLPITDIRDFVSVIPPAVGDDSPRRPSGIHILPSM